MHFCPSGKPLERAALQCKMQVYKQPSDKKAYFWKVWILWWKGATLLWNDIFFSHFSQMDKPLLHLLFLCGTGIIFTKCSVRTQKVRDLEKSCTFFLSLEHSCTWAWNNLHLAEKGRWASCVQKYISHGFSRRAPWLCQRQTLKYLFIFTLSSFFSAEYSTIGALFNRHR